MSLPDLSGCGQHGRARLEHQMEASMLRQPEQLLRGGTVLYVRMSWPFSLFGSATPARRTAACAWPDMLRVGLDYPGEKIDQLILLSGREY